MYFSEIIIRLSHLADFPLKNFDSEEIFIRKLVIGDFISVCKKAKIIRRVISFILNGGLS